MDIFRPFRPETPYAPGYGEYPTAPGNYMNGLGDIVFGPGRDYGAWGYQAGGGQHTPRGNWGYGIYGLGDQHGNGNAIVNGNGTPTAGGGAEAAWSASVTFGVPVVTGLVGLVGGVLLGYFVFRR